MDKCGAVILFDEYYDKDAIFQCSLEEGHEGLHRAVNEDNGQVIFTLTWPEDARKICEVCGEKSLSHFTCGDCGKSCCEKCSNHTYSLYQDNVAFEVSHGKLYGRFNETFVAHAVKADIYRFYCKEHLKDKEEWVKGWLEQHGVPLRLGSQMRP